MQNVEDILRERGLAGKLYGANFGSLTAPLTTPATSAITVLRPMAWLRVPDGTAIYIIRNKVVVESAGATTQGEIALAISDIDVGNGTSAAATLLENLNNTLKNVATADSLVTGRQLASADVVSPAVPFEVNRYSFAASAVDLEFEWKANEEGILIPITGPGTFLIYIGGNAVNFFAQTLWYETKEG